MSHPRSRCHRRLSSRRQCSCRVCRGLSRGRRAREAHARRIQKAEGPTGPGLCRDGIASAATSSPPRFRPCRARARWGPRPSGSVAREPLARGAPRDSPRQTRHEHCRRDDSRRSHRNRGWLHRQPAPALEAYLMRLRILGLALLATLALTATASAQPQQWSITPQAQVGQFRPDTPYTLSIPSPGAGVVGYGHRTLGSTSLGWRGQLGVQAPEQPRPPLDRPRRARRALQHRRARLPRLRARDLGHQPGLVADAQLRVAGG